MKTFPLCFGLFINFLCFLRQISSAFNQGQIMMYLSFSPFWFSCVMHEGPIMSSWVIFYSAAEIWPLVSRVMKSYISYTFFFLYRAWKSNVAADKPPQWNKGRCHSLGAKQKLILSVLWKKRCWEEIFSDPSKVELLYWLGPSVKHES